MSVLAFLGQCPRYLVFIMIIYGIARLNQCQGLSSLHNNTETCIYQFKVYVYPLPSHFIEASEGARRNQTYHVCRKCIFEQFALEYIIYDFFTQFCGRTYNPDEADFFYLPIVREIDYRLSMHNRGGRDPSIIEQTLIAVIERNDSILWKHNFRVTDFYWFRRGGSDHIIVMPAPVTNLRHQSNARGFFHYMIHLNTPIFINVEYSRSFIGEYPICSMKKNIVVPYPTTDPQLFSGALPSMLSNTTSTEPRDKLIFYQGGHHGSCEPIRSALTHIMRTATKYVQQRGDKKREQGFLTAKYCPVPIGDSPSSKRMYDAIHFGCVPVLLSDEALWAFSKDTGGYLNPKTFSLQFPQRIVQRTATQLLEEGLAIRNHTFLTQKLPISQRSLLSLIEAVAKDESEEYRYSSSSNHSALRGMNTLVRVLLKIENKDLSALQHGLRIASYHYTYYSLNKTMTDIPTAQHVFPTGGAIQALANELNKRKVMGIDNIRIACNRERFTIKHNYIGKYPCELFNKQKI